MSRSGKSTRRAKTLPGKIMSIPELKESFAIIDKNTHSILKADDSMSEKVKKFQSLWKSVFHRTVSAEAAESFLQIKRASKGRKNTTKKQKGGSFAPLAGAPLDYTTRPGVDGVYGSFPAYMTSGLDNYNKINQEAMFQECGTKDFSASVSSGIGTNEVR